MTENFYGEHRAEWNGWQISEFFELSYPAYFGGAFYPLDVEQFTSSAAMLDMIMQVAKKPWATDACLAGLVRALNDLLQPQAYLCSCGTNRYLTPEQIQNLIKIGIPDERTIEAMKERP